MSETDDEPSDEVDREAILERRRQFVAEALGHDDGRIEQAKPEVQASAPEDAARWEQVPRPCLLIAMPPRERWWQRLFRR